MRFHYYIFVLFLKESKNVLSLDLLLVVIYGMKFNSFSWVSFGRILKNNRIGFQSVFSFLINDFLRANHRQKIEELSDIKNNCHYGGDSKIDCD
jgi:hypothetical protein